MAPRPQHSGDARRLVRNHERSVADGQRRTEGVHYTPPEVAAAVIEVAFDALGQQPAVVCDPSCGGGAFLLSVADRLHCDGVPAGEVVRSRLVGLELDPDAVEVARRALSRWAQDHGAMVDPQEVAVHRGDALQMPTERWPRRPDDGFDLVIGNPPFLSQLSLDTARDSERRAAVVQRFGPLGAYTDDAGLFLLLGMELLADGGVVAMIQPQSVLSARDAAQVRARLRQDGRIVALWAHLGTPFPDADVQVCAPVVRRGGAPSAASGAPEPAELAEPTEPELGDVAGHDRVHVAWDDGVGSHRGTAWLAADAPRWGPLLGEARGIPDTPPLGGRPLSEVATATAGFRDEFYALCSVMRVAAPGDTAALPGLDSPRLVTVGMIDPMVLRHRDVAHRIGGAEVTAPTVDMGALADAHPRVARWAAARLRPKVLVATQTRIVEAVADPAGDCVPMTPTISVEPIGDLIDLWHLVAALVAPPVAAEAVREHLGAGRSAAALRWSAAGVLEVSLPVDDERWARGAALVRELHSDAPGTPAVATMTSSARRELMEELGSVMTEAHGLAADHPVVAWWSERIPRR